MENRGKFIVIDGSDGSGKKTQADLLIKHLESKGYQVAFFDFPQYDKTFFGKMVGRYLNGEFSKEGISPYLFSLLTAGDRWQASAEIKKELANGKIVISNRYTQSNMAHQSARLKTEKEKNEYLKWLSELEYDVYEIPRADLVIYLNVPFDVSQKLIEKKAARAYTKSKKDLHEKDLDFMRKSQEEYLKLSKIYPEWRRIDCTEGDQILAISEIAKKVQKIVKNEI